MAVSSGGRYPGTTSQITNGERRWAPFTRGFEPCRDEGRAERAVVVRALCHRNILPQMLTSFTSLVIM